MRSAPLLFALVVLIGCSKPPANAPAPPDENVQPLFPDAVDPNDFDPNAAPTIPPDFMAPIAGPGLIDEQFPLPQNLDESKKLRDRKYQWARQQTVAAFDAHGNTSAPWADKARLAMDAFARRNARLVSNAPGIEHQEFLAAVGAAVDAGADDVLLLYWKARFLDLARATQAWQDLSNNDSLAAYRTVKERVRASQYPAQIKIHIATALWYGFELARKQGLDVAADELAEAERYCWEQVQEAATSAASLDRHNVFQALRAILLAHADGGDGGEAFWKTTKKRLQDGKADAWLLQMVEGDFLIRFAWHARGGGFANTVTPQGWKLFSERLTQAQEHLLEAARIDPTLPEPFVGMVTVAKGAGFERREMEKWFRRAMTADPDNFDAGVAKMMYLLPKWHGSIEECVAFADQCLRTKNYEARLPMLAVLIMTSLQESDPQAFGPPAKHPLMWNRIQAAFEGTLALEPDDHMMRTSYLRYCWLADKKALAHEQFEHLGKNVMAEFFSSREELESRRNECRLHATPKQ